MALSFTNYDTLAEMITPALFMTATGSLIASTATRIGRIVDRIRVLVDQGENLSRGLTQLDFPEVRREQIRQHLEQLEARSNRALSAVKLLYLAFGLFVSCSLAVAFDTLLQHYLIWLPVIFSISGVAAMLGACFNLVLEAVLALKNNQMTLRFYRDLEALRASQQSTLSNTAPASSNPVSQ